MPGRPPNPVLRLPRQWNTRVRSAVLHVVSLAHLALTAARAQAIERHQARTHRFCELDRLRRELNLLREEIRLKDARMARIPGHRRPYYQSTERSPLITSPVGSWDSQSSSNNRLRQPSEPPPGEPSGRHDPVHVIGVHLLAGLNGFRDSEWLIRTRRGAT